uniref:Uncharacterized protein n=1 Tax=Anguilla anguilla TaxID=7936 RepID=A0A0E9SUH9_ANGAN
MLLGVARRLPEDTSVRCTSGAYAEVIFFWNV